MNIVGPAKRLRIYIGESDQWHGRSLYAVLLDTLKREGLAGATVLRGVAGFGAHSRIHIASIERLSEDLPLLVEVVDSPGQIEHALTIVGPMVREGLITVDDITVVKYSHRYLQPLPGDRPVKDVMTRDVVSIQPETPLAEVMDLLIGKLVKAVPVLDKSGKPLGIISDGDLLERGGVPLRLAAAEKLDEATLAAQLAELRRGNKTAAEIMTRDLVTVREDTSLAHAVQIMAGRNLKRLPVVDGAGRLTGMLSRVDVLRTVAKPQKVGSRPLPHAGHTVGEVMNTEIPSVKADADLVEIVNVMTGTDVKRVVVLDEIGRAIGVITDGDLVARVRPEARAGLLAALFRRGRVPQTDVVARDLMSPDVLKGPPETPIAEAVRQMLQQKRKRFYVVDAQGKPLGIVDRQTLLLAVAGMSVKNS